MSLGKSLLSRFTLRAAPSTTSVGLFAQPLPTPCLPRLLSRGPGCPAPGADREGRLLQTGCLGPAVGTGEPYSSRTSPRGRWHSARHTEQHACGVREPRHGTARCFAGHPALRGCSVEPTWRAGDAGPCVQSDPRGSEPQVVLAPQDNGLSSESSGGPAGCGRVSEIAGDGDSPQRDQPQAPSARALPWKWSFRVLLVRPTSDAQICPLKEKSGRRRPRHGAGHPSRAERVCGLVLMKGPLYPGTPRLQPPQALGASQQLGSPLRSGKVGFSARSAGSGLPTKGVYTAGVGLRPQDRPLRPRGRQGLISAQSLRLPFSRRPFPAKPLGRSGVAT